VNSKHTSPCDDLMRSEASSVNPLRTAGHRPKLTELHRKAPSKDVEKDSEPLFPWGNNGPKRVENAQRQFENHLVAMEWNKAAQVLREQKGVDPAANDNSLIQWASQHGHATLVRLLLKDGRVDPSANLNHSIRLASENNHARVVRLLLRDKRVNPSDCFNYAIKRASESGHAKVVRLLLKDGRADPSADTNYSIRWASDRGHTEVVRALLRDKRVNPAAMDNLAIQCASAKGDVKTVRLLLGDSRIDPSALDNLALWMARQHQHENMVRLLLSSARVARLATHLLWNWNEYMTTEEMAMMMNNQGLRHYPQSANDRNPSMQAESATEASGNQFCALVVIVLREQGSVPEDVSRAVVLDGYLTSFPYP
jgi:hypothetical protein